MIGVSGMPRKSAGRIQPNRDVISLFGVHHRIVDKETHEDGYVTLVSETGEKFRRPAGTKLEVVR